jgi:hypothetical protein
VAFLRIHLFLALYTLPAPRVEWRDVRVGNG